MRRRGAEIQAVLSIVIYSIMKYFLRKKFLQTAALGFSAIFFLAGLYFYKSSRPVFVKKFFFAITLTKDGFSPASLTIRQGDTVKFKTEAGKDFWPASDLHPTHEIYSEFDPKQPIAPGQSWSFTFDKIGGWQYHNHLFSKHRGVIVVLGENQSSVSAPLAATSARDCETANSKVQCWERLMDYTLHNQGLDSAFRLIADLYGQEPGFAGQCHGFSHTLGQAAYKLFAAGKEVGLTAKTSYCGYGFYHGVVETLLQTSGDIEQARQFCKYAGEKLKGQTSDAEGACYHGIGHGAVDGGDPSAWGNPQKMIDPAMKLCEGVAGHDRTRYGKLYRCTSGAYNALEILSNDGKYKLTQIVKNPFYLCPSQPQNYKESCYTNMLPALQRFVKNDFIKGARAIENIQGMDPGRNIKDGVMLGWFHEYINRHLQIADYGVKEGIKLCRQMEEPSRLPCIMGLSGGHMKYGEPEKEYVKSLAFCQSPLLKPDERDACYKYILERLLIWYSPEKTKKICGSAPENFRKYCRL